MGKKKLFGDEMFQSGPLKYLHEKKNEKWLNSRAKLSKSQLDQQMVERNKANGSSNEKILTGKE